MTPITTPPKSPEVQKQRTWADVLSLFALIVLLIVMFGASFRDGECEAEVRPMICIPVYHFFQSEK